MVKVNLQKYKGGEKGKLNASSPIRFFQSFETAMSSKVLKFSVATPSFSAEILTWQLCPSFAMAIIKFQLGLTKNQLFWDDFVFFPAFFVN